MTRMAFLLLLAGLMLGWAGSAGSQDRDAEGLLDDLEKILRDEKKKSNYDRDLVRRLESLLRKHRGRSGGDSGGGAEDSGGRSGGGSRGGGGGGGSWNSPEAIVGRILDGIELREDQREAVTRILVEFWTSRTLLRTNDHMDCYPDVERDRNNRLAKAVGSKKAKEIIEAVDELINRWSRWGGRGGGGR